jgi:hypothetical protein
MAKQSAVIPVRVVGHYAGLAREVGFVHKGREKKKAIGSFCFVELKSPAFKQGSIKFSTDLF